MMPDMNESDKLFRGECTFMRGVDDLSQLPPEGLPEVAFAGRSNVGKSSLINALTGRKALARTSNTPGRTQQLNFFNLADHLVMVDMPGYGYAKVSKSKIKAWVKTLRKYLCGRVPLRLCCLMVDGRHGLKDSDREMMDMLDEAAVPYRIILTKGDKMSGQKVVEDVTAELKKHPAAFPTPHVTSSQKNEGISELREIIVTACA